MIKRILLYGATGYSGRLIAREARRGMESGALPNEEVVLGGRDRFALARLGRECSLPHVVFGLDDRSRVEDVLSEFDVVLNAAGPFADTGIRLAKAAIAVQCHYVDINGEVGVYKALDDLARAAEDRGVRLCRAPAACDDASDVMVRWAVTLLRHVRPQGLALRRRAHRRVRYDAPVARKSLTTLRSIREEVTIVRDGKDAVHVPVGAPRNEHSTST
jgi:hypothetical protein